MDPNGVLRASDRIVELLTEVATAPVGPPAIDEYPTVVERERIRVRPARVGAVLGLDVSSARVQDALLPLGIDIEDIGEPDAFVAVPPTFRPDLVREIDIVEEVGRRIGLDSIPRTLPHTTEQSGGLTVARMSSEGEAHDEPVNIDCSICSVRDQHAADACTA